MMYERKTKTNNTKKIIGATLVTLGVFSLSYSVNIHTDKAQAVDSPLITMANVSREDAGVDVLFPNKKLADAAQAKANDILDQQYFEHTRPDGMQPWDFIKEQGYNYRYAGENLAIGFNSYTDVQDAWMNSQSHKENILSNRFDEIGIGIAKGIYDGREAVVIVEMFGRD